MAVFYADQLALQASTISNGTEFSNVAAHESGVIASRDTLNIGAQSILQLYRVTDL